MFCLLRCLDDRGLNKAVLPLLYEDTNAKNAQVLKLKNIERVVHVD